MVTEHGPKHPGVQGLCCSERNQEAPKDLGPSPAWHYPLAPRLLPDSSLLPAPLQELACPPKTEQSWAGVSGWYPRGSTGRAQKAWRENLEATESPHTQTNADVSPGRGEGLPVLAREGEGLSG